MIKIATLSVESLSNQLTNQQPLYLVDVRQKWEYDICHLANSIHIPLNELADRLSELPRTKAIVMICHHGIRSQQAAALLLKSGFNNVASLEGGINAWAQRIDPTMAVY